MFINRELQKLDKKLQKNRLLFERECKILLKRVVSDEGVNAMLSDNTHVMWTEAGFKAKWDKVYGTHFDDHMEEVRKVMVDINMELVKICGLYAPTNGQSLITADVSVTLRSGFVPIHLSISFKQLRKKTTK